MARSYVRKNGEGLYYITGTRVALEPVWRAFQAGVSPESIQMDLPALSLEQTYGAITFCLANPTLVEAYLRRVDRIAEHAANGAQGLAPPVRRRIRQRSTETRA